MQVKEAVPSVAEVTERFQKMITCTLCDEIQKEPKLLSCLHSFCEGCLNNHIQDKYQDEIVAQQHSPKRKPKPEAVTEKDTSSEHNCDQVESLIIQCPECSRKVKVPEGGVVKLRDNSLVTTILRCVDQATANQGKEENTPGTANEKEQTNDAKPNETLVIHEDETTIKCVKEKNGDINNKEGTTDQKEDDITRNRSLMAKMTGCLDVRIENEHHRLITLQNINNQASSQYKELTFYIEEKSRALLQAIQNRRNKLLKELENIYGGYLQQLKTLQETCTNKKTAMEDVYWFSNCLLQFGDQDDMTVLYNDVMEHMNMLLIESLNQKLNYINVKLQTLEVEKPELVLEKMIGSVLQGCMDIGQVELVKSFRLNLNWPVGLVVTKQREVIVIGKSGAFDNKGSVFFYNSHGQLHHTFDYPASHVPTGIAVNSKEEILVTDNCGEILKFSTTGKLMSIWNEKFKGTGSLAIGHDDKIVVTSPDEHAIHVYNQYSLKLFSITGTIPVDDTPAKRIPVSPDKDLTMHPLVQQPRSQSSFKLPGSEMASPASKDKPGGEYSLKQPYGVTVTQQDQIIVSEVSEKKIMAFNSLGHLLFSYRGPSHIESGLLKCPTSVCADMFGNILIADFSNDRIALVSNKGEFLGFLLTKEHGISCPNFISLDQDGNLFVGQYGGEICVFRYISYMKQI